MVKTAKEFLEATGAMYFTELKQKEETLIEFAKLHVEAALQAASENATTINKPKFKGDINYVVDEDSILNAYPIENIK
jgi:hypothetical protein